MNMRVKTLTIAEAEAALKEGDSLLYVVNQTQPECMIMIPVRAEGAESVVTVPVTWAPFDLSTAAGKAAVLQSPGFRSFVARGFIKIVDTKSAEEMFRTSAVAQEELRRANDTIFKSTSGNADTGGSELVIKPKNGVRSKAETNTQTVQPRVMTLVNHVDSEEITSENASNLLANLSTLTVADRDYILANSQSPALREFAASLDL